MGLLHDEELRPGTALGPFELLVPVGSGGMARVWAARVRATGHVVALKMLLPELAQSVSFQQMFLDEARIASRIQHPNVCATYELGQHDTIQYLAMEWIDGGSLARLLRPGPDDEDNPVPKVPIPPRLAARILADACSGLHAAHELVGDDGRSLGVVHRDVSPHNVLLTTDGDVKVTDFGVAKALGKSHVTMAGQIKGKLAYMAPEQLTGGTVDRRSDVFALGCVLYEVTTGRKPFVGDHDPQVMTSIVLGRFLAPSAVMQGYPRDLEAVVLQALAGEPERRFRSADHMRRALETWLQASGPPVTAIQVARLLRERCGSEIDARMHALTAGGVLLPASPSAGSGITSTTGRTRMPEAGYGFGWIATAVVVGAGLGLVVISGLRAAPKHTTPTVAAASATYIELPSPPSTDKGEPGSTAHGEPARQDPVKLRITPTVPATLTVGDVVMPAGTERVARPGDGGTVVVLVHAEGYEDALVAVDATVPDELDVLLVPRKPAAIGLPTPKLIPPAPARSGGEAPGTKPSNPRNGGQDAEAEHTETIEAPPNPYD